MTRVPSLIVFFATASSLLEEDLQLLCIEEAAIAGSSKEQKLGF